VGAARGSHGTAESLTVPPHNPKVQPGNISSLDLMATHSLQKLHVFYIGVGIFQAKNLQCGIKGELVSSLV